MAKEPSRATRLVDMIQEDAAVMPPASTRRFAHEGEHARRTAPSKQTAPRCDKPAEDTPLDAAMKRAVALLEYGDNSHKRLVRKLVDRGFDEDVAECAVSHLEEMGYLREHDACARRAEQGVRKGWGKRRIAQDLYAQRYDRETVDAVMAALEDTVDFAENCVNVIRKKYRTVPTDRDARRKIAAALMRLGYGSDEVRRAMQAVAEDSAE